LLTFLLAVIFGFMGEVTQILDAIDQGDSHAAERLLTLVYDECAGWPPMGWPKKSQGKLWTPPL
jgi:hypothetical protein